MTKFFEWVVHPHTVHLSFYSLLNPREASENWLVLPSKDIQIPIIHTFTYFQRAVVSHLSWCFSAGFPTSFIVPTHAVWVMLLKQQSVRSWHSFAHTPLGVLHQTNATCSAKLPLYGPPLILWCHLLRISPLALISSQSLLRPHCPSRSSSGMLCTPLPQNLVLAVFLSEVFPFSKVFAFHFL